MGLIENERVKLLAGAIDRVSTASITVGVLAPAAAAIYATAVTGLNLLVYAVAAIVWLLVGAALHLTARWVLGGLRQ